MGGSTIIICKYLLTFSNFLDKDMQYITFSGHELCKQIPLIC